MIFTSPYPDVEIPEQSLTDFVLGGSLPTEREAYIDGATGEVLTYGALHERVARTAHGLLAAGLQRGDRVALFAPSSPSYAVAFHAVTAAGGTSALINALATPAELAHYLSLCTPRFILCDEALREKVDAVRHAATVYTLNGTLGRLMEGQPATLPALDPPIDPRTELVAVPFSSGTTGRSKGVMLTHHGLVSELCMLHGAKDVTLMEPGDRVLAVLPLFHIYGIVAFLSYNLRARATVVMMPRFDLRGFLELAQQHQVTRLHVVPPIALALAKHPMIDEFDLSHLRGAVCAAAPLGDTLAQEFIARLHIPIAQAYGMTELTGASHHGADHGGREYPSSAGLLLPNMEARLVDTDSGNNVGPNQRGELWLRGPIVMKGYLGDPEATAETIDADGWLHTGDIGTVDERGNYFIVDRVKELIKYKGMQVAPAELEDVLLRHPAVADVAVVGVPDDEAGEIPKAFVVKRAGTEVDADALIAFVATHVTGSKRVRQVELVPSIPRSAAGKILRRLLLAPES